MSALLLLFTHFGCIAQGAGLKNDGVDNPMIETARQLLIKSTQQWPARGLRVEHKVLAGAPTNAPCKQFNAGITGNGQAWGRTLVQLQCSQPASPAERSWTGFVAFDVQIHGPVLIARHSLTANSLPSASEFLVEERNWTTLTLNPQTIPASLSDLPERQLAQAISPGQILRLEQLRAKPLIASGSPVSVQLRIGGLLVATHGTSLGQGQIGQSIKVQTEQGGILLGVIKNAREIEVVWNN